MSLKVYLATEKLACPQKRKEKVCFLVPLFILSCLPFSGVLKMKQVSKQCRTHNQCYQQSLGAIGNYF